MEYVKVFLFGFLFWYIIQMLDLMISVLDSFVQVLLSHITVILTEHQVMISKYQQQIEEIVGGENTEKQSAIGFVLDENDYE